MVCKSINGIKRIISSSRKKRLLWEKMNQETNDETTNKWIKKMFNQSGNDQNRQIIRNPIRSEAE